MQKGCDMAIMKMHYHDTKHGYQLQLHCRNHQGKFYQMNWHLRQKAGTADGAKFELYNQEGKYLDDMWIVQADDYYDFVVLASPSKRYAWVLSRTPRMDPDTLKVVLHRFKNFCFNLKHFERVGDKSVCPAVKPPPCVNYPHCLTEHGNHQQHLHGLSHFHLQRKEPEDVPQPLVQP